MALQLSDSFSQLPKAFGLVWRVSRWRTALLVGTSAAAAATPLAMLFVARAIVEAVVARSTPQTLRWVEIELGLVCVQTLLERGGSLLRAILGARLGLAVNLMILGKAVTLELRHFEEAEFYDQLSRARREASSRPISVITESLRLMQHLLTVVGCAAVLLRFSVAAVIALVIASLPATFSEMRFSLAAFRLHNWRSSESRRLTYLGHVLATDDHAKEVKVMGLGPLLLDRYRSTGERLNREDEALAAKRAGLGAVLSSLGTFAYYGCYGAVAWMAAHGRMSLGQMTLYMIAFRQGQQAFQGILGGLGGMYEHNLYMSNLFAFLASPTDPKEPRRLTELVPEPPGPPGLRFEGVGYRYPGVEHWALAEVTLTIPQGQSVALVGPNGAGKTTLIKLLTRLYQPTVGRILLDGLDLRDWPLEALRARLAVIFQDFNKYQLSARENIGLGSVAHLSDDLRLRRATAQGGAEALVNDLPLGLDTQLGRLFEDGFGLSGGQWQKIALARGFMREEADIVVLDEPTAALDAEAEHALFERFRRLTRGRTTVLISHRLSTVRTADRILMFEQGRIVEEGTHAELVARGSRYARLFELQAKGYA